MKTRILFFFSFVLMLSIAISSCGHKHSHNNADEQGKEYTSKYICPMHCEGSGSEEPGECPVCGMDYVLNEKHNGTDHDHDDHSHDHGDHNHD